VVSADAKGYLASKVDYVVLYDQCKMQLDAGVKKETAITRAVDAAISLAAMQ